jgi:hypothetical protein
MEEYYDNIDKKDPRSAVAIPKVDDQEISRFGTMILAGISILLVLVTLPFSLCYCVKVKIIISLVNSGAAAVLPSVPSASFDVCLM